MKFTRYSLITGLLAFITLPLPSFAQSALKQGDTTHPIVFLVVDSTTHLNGLTGATPVIKISKNGGTGASPSGTVAQVDATNNPGLYKFTQASGDVSTMGVLHITVITSGGDPVDKDVQIVAYDPFDATALGLSTVSSTGTAVAALPNASAIASAVWAISLDTGLNMKQSQALVAAVCAGNYLQGTLNTSSHQQTVTYYKANGTTPLDVANVQFASDNKTILTRTNTWSNLP